MNLDRYILFAGYNVWANERLYNAAEKLSDQEYRADRGAFFKSIHGTLNHVLVADRIWMKRFTGQGEAPNKLDVILFDDLAALRAARDREDARISAYVSGLTEEELAATFSYLTIVNPKTSRSRSHLRSTISSTTRPTTAARRMPCYGLAGSRLRALLRHDPLSAGNRRRRRGKWVSSCPETGKYLK